MKILVTDGAERPALAIVRALLTDAGGERYAVPLAYVAETVEFSVKPAPRRTARSVGRNTSGSPIARMAT